jgi:hypothetical protein
MPVVDTPTNLRRPPVGGPVRIGDRAEVGDSPSLLGRRHRLWGVPRPSVHLQQVDIERVELVGAEACSFVLVDVVGVVVGTRSRLAVIARQGVVGVDVVDVVGVDVVADVVARLSAQGAQDVIDAHSVSTHHDVGRPLNAKIALGLSTAKLSLSSLTYLTMLSVKSPPAKPMRTESGSRIQTRPILVVSSKIAVPAGHCVVVSTGVPQMVSGSSAAGSGVIRYLSSGRTAAGRPG